MVKCQQKPETYGGTIDTNLLMYSTRSFMKSIPTNRCVRLRIVRMPWTGLAALG